MLDHSGLEPVGTVVVQVALLLVGGLAELLIVGVTPAATLVNIISTLCPLLPLLTTLICAVSTKVPPN